jgi:hypothetical protein
MYIIYTGGLSYGKSSFPTAFQFETGEGGIFGSPGGGAFNALGDTKDFVDYYQPPVTSSKLL